MLLFSRVAPLMTAIDIGTSCASCSRFCAVTTTVSIWPALTSCACATPGTKERKEPPSKADSSSRRGVRRISMQVSRYSIRGSPSFRTQLDSGGVDGRLVASPRHGGFKVGGGAEDVILPAVTGDKLHPDRQTAAAPSAGNGCGGLAGHV